MSVFFFFFLMIRRPPRSTLDRSSAASDVYKRQVHGDGACERVAILVGDLDLPRERALHRNCAGDGGVLLALSLIHISEPTRPY